MNDTVVPSPIATAYEKQGFYFPYDLTSEAEATELLADLEAAEGRFAGDRVRLSQLRSYPSQLLPSFAALIRHPRLIEGVSQIIGLELRLLHQRAQPEKLRELASGSQLLGPRRQSGGHRVVCAHAGDDRERL